MAPEPAVAAMVVFSHYPADPRVRREAEALSDNGIMVDVICLKGEGEATVEVFGGVTAYRVLTVKGRQEKLYMYLAYSALFCLKSFMRLALLSIKKRYLFIQAHNMPDFLVFAGIGHKAAGIPLIIDLHDLSVELFSTRTAGSIARKLLPVVRVVEFLSCAVSDRVITTSAGFRDSLVTRGINPEKITVVLNSADEKIFRYRRREWKVLTEGPKILYHGTVAERFGLHVAIEAVSILKASMPQTRLFIYGKYDQSYRERLIELINTKKLTQNVFLEGYLPLDLVSEEISRCDIGIAPYLSDEFMDLALSTKVFEYVSTGMPVAAARVKSLKLVFDEECLEYFSPGDPGELASALKRMCLSPADRRSKSEAALKRYEEISWTVMSERYRQTITSLTTAWA